MSISHFIDEDDKKLECMAPVGISQSLGFNVRK